MNILKINCIFLFGNSMINRNGDNLCHNLCPLGGHSVTANNTVNVNHTKWDICDKLDSECIEGIIHVDDHPPN
ncbi:hypothetical protein H5410_005877 [Solanum commersonii]|uniref:Uncharacterized protein n=1 Tax=Solanum commersonii TaxID=4109 RepID=A0A9J6A8P7_SOLCO|nr:hypothetical protein H5410_005877 [Solanum commersonii]